MRLRDVVIKPAARDFWLHHTASSYRVRMDASALSALEGLLSRTAPDELSPDERHIHDRLAARGMIEPDADGPPVLPPRASSPLQALDVELSSRCNLACRHCFAALDGRLMPREILDRVLEGAAELQPVTLVLNGGEPLLHPDLRRVVEVARRENLRVVLMTNATAVTPDLAAFLAAARVARVIVSLDGFEDEHDRLRGPGSHRRAVAGIRRLVAERLPVSVTTMLSDALAGRLEDFERYCREDLGVVGIRLSAVMPVGKAASDPCLPHVDDAVLRRLRGAGRLREDYEDHTDDSAWPCGAGVEQCFIGADGSVFACHYFQNLGEPLGNLSEASLADIYRAAQQGPVAQRLPWRQLASCADCPALSTCRGGCRARAKLLGGSFEARDPFACRLHR